MNRFSLRRAKSALVSAVPSVAAAKRASSSQLFEVLEPRKLFAVSVGSDGWTDITKSSDTRVVYVSSSSGSDTNSGLSESSPVKTLAKAKGLMRNGMPDWMLLKRGDTWSEAIGGWSRSGRSASEPMVIGSYGTSSARPLLKTGTSNGIDFGGKQVDHLAIVGIHFYAHTRDTESSSYAGTTMNYGMRFVGGSDGLLLEDNVVDNYGTNVMFQPWEGTLQNIKIRRNVITDAYATGSSQSGIYISAANNVTIEGNVLDHNGYNPKVSSSYNMPGHNIYMQHGANNVTVRGNIIADAGSHGIQARGGGIIKDNLFVNNPIGMSFGLVNGAYAEAGGVTGEVSGNVFQGTRDIVTAGRGWGQALELGNIKSATVASNVFSHDGLHSSAAILLTVGSGVDNASQTVGINNLTITDNVVYDWAQAVSLHSNLVPGGTGSSAVNNLRVEDNDFQSIASTRMVYHGSKFSSSEEVWSSNRYYDDSSTSGWFYLSGSTTSYDAWKSKVESSATRSKASYVAPTRTMASYNGTLGGTSSVSAFLDEARTQGSRSWQSGYTASGAISYVKSGFGEGSAPAEDPVDAPTTGDTTRPTVLSSTISAGKITVRFSEDVSGSVAIGDLNLVNVANWNSLDKTKMAYSYDKSTNTATWTFPGFTNDVLPSGTYQFKLRSTWIWDASGNYLSADYVRKFTV